GVPEAQDHRQLPARATRKCSIAPTVIREDPENYQGCGVSGVENARRIKRITRPGSYSLPAFHCCVMLSQN
ncbi:hypothetical protein, partial [Xanthomonas cucurbitae]|uniref:hypothetical protein n=1 Tax=Xanthomonas cucurbitae TaxID=56453 RepID=UPI001B7FFA9C